MAKANALAKEKGWEQFISIQGHHSLLLREEEREMVPFYLEDNIAMTPYGEHTKIYDENVMAKRKYDTIIDKEQGIIERVEELANIKDVLMSEISLAWLMYKKKYQLLEQQKNLILSHLYDN